MLQVLLLSVILATASAIQPLERGSDEPIGGTNVETTTTNREITIRRFNPKEDKLEMSNAKGLWYQVAVNREFYHQFEHGCSCPIEFLQPRNQTYANVIYACVNGTDTLNVVRGSKLMTDNGDFHLNMVTKTLGRKFVPIPKDTKGAVHDEFIVAKDEKGKWVIIAAPELHGVFVYSRTANIEKDLLHHIFEFIETNTKGRVKASDMKIMKHTEHCGSILNPLIRKYKRYIAHQRFKRDIGERYRNLFHEQFVDEFSGTESSPLEEKKGKRVLDLNLMNGVWYEIIRTHGTAEHGCQCGLGSFNASEGTTLNMQFSCLNATVTGGANKIVTASARAVMDPHMPGVFRSKMLSRPPGKLSDEESKDSKMVLLALGKEFAALFNPETKAVHILSRTPTMAKDLTAALRKMVESLGVKESTLNIVKQDESTCSAFQSHAKEQFGAGAATSVSGHDKSKAVERNESSSAPASSEKHLISTSDEEGVAPLAAPATAKAEAPKGTPAFDATLLGGNWFAIAVSQAGYDTYMSGCECTQGFVTALDTNNLHLILACANSTDQQMVSCVGEGAQDANTPGLFHLRRLDRQPYGLSDAEKNTILERVVIATGSDFALLGDETLNSAIILSRTPQMAPDLYDRLTKILQGIGFDITQLRAIRQDLPQCQVVTKEMQELGKAAATPAAPVAPAAPAAPPAPAAPTTAAPPAATIAGRPRFVQEIGEQPLMQPVQQTSGQPYLVSIIYRDDSVGGDDE